MSTPKPNRQKHYTNEDDRLIWNHVLKIAKEVAPNKGTICWNSFADIEKLGRKKTDIGKHFYRMMKPKIHMAPFEDSEKVMIYRFLNVPVPEEYVQTLKETCDISLQEDGTITTEESMKNEREVINNSPLKNEPVFSTVGPATHSTTSTNNSEIPIEECISLLKNSIGHLETSEFRNQIDRMDEIVERLSGKMVSTERLRLALNTLLAVIHPNSRKSILN